MSFHRHRDIRERRYRERRFGALSFHFGSIPPRLSALQPTLWRARLLKKSGAATGSVLRRTHAPDRHHRSDQDIPNVGHVNVNKLPEAINSFSYILKVEPRPKAKHEDPCYLEERSDSEADLSKPLDRVVDESNDQLNATHDENRLSYGRRRIEGWKNTKGRGKEWRTCPVTRNTSDNFRKISHHVNGGYISCDCDMVGTEAPVSYLMAQQGFRNSRQPRPPLPQRPRKNGKNGHRSQYKFLKNQMIQGHGDTADVPESPNPSPYSDDAIHSVLRILREPASELPNSSTIFLPKENYVGAVLGSQFRLGRLVRHEKIADVYEITHLTSETHALMEVLAYNLKDHPKASRREIRFRKPFTLCSIDQSGKKYLVYRVENRKQYEMEARKTKKRNKRDSRRVSEQHETSPDITRYRFMEVTIQHHPHVQPKAIPTIRSQRVKKSEQAGPLCDSWASRASSKAARSVKFGGVEKQPRDSLNKPISSTTARRWKLGKPSPHTPHWEFMNCPPFFKPDSAPKFQTLSELSGMIQVLTERPDDYQTEIQLSRLAGDFKDLDGSVWRSSEEVQQRNPDKLSWARITLCQRYHFWFWLEEEHRMLCQLVDIIGGQIEHNEGLIELAWEKVSGYRPRHSSLPILESSKFASFTRSSLLRRKPSFAARLRRIAEHMDYEHAVYMRDSWAHMISQVRVGKWDAWLVELHLWDWGVESAFRWKNKYPTVFESFYHFRGLVLTAPDYL